MRRPKRSLHLVAAAALVLSLSAPGAAKAASIFIDAFNLMGPPERVAFNFGQFEGGFSINGSSPITTGGSVFGNTTLLNFTGQWIDLGAATSFSRTVYWVDVKFPTVAEEILNWTITPSGASGLATISGSFIGSSGTPLPGGLSPSDVIVRVKDGSHNPFNFSAAFLGGQVITNAIPEPGTLTLLGVGLLGLGFAVRRKRLAA